MKRSRKKTNKAVIRHQHKGVPPFWKFFNPRLSRDYSGGEREQIVVHQMLLALFIMLFAALAMTELYVAAIAK